MLSRSICFCRRLLARRCCDSSFCCVTMVSVTSVSLFCSVCDSSMSLSLSTCATWYRHRISCISLCPSALDVSFLYTTITVCHTNHLYHTRSRLLNHSKWKWNSKTNLADEGGLLAEVIISRCCERADSRLSFLSVRWKDSSRTLATGTRLSMSSVTLLLTRELACT